MKNRQDVTLGLRAFLRESEDVFNINSCFVTGSYATNNIHSFSDFDLVIVGKDSNRIEQLCMMRKKLIGYFVGRTAKKVTFFSEPAFERLYYKGKHDFSTFLVHIIYHPFSRFLSYINSNDPIVISWSKNYVHIYGEDHLESANLDVKRLDCQFLNSELDTILQMIQNLFLTGELEDDMAYFTKTYLFCVKRILEVSSMQQFEKYFVPFENELNEYVEDMKEIDRLVCSPDRILKRLTAIEGLVIGIKESII